MALGSNQPFAPGIFPGGKGGRCVGLTTLPPSCVDYLKIWDPQPPGTLRACNGIALPFRVSDSRPIRVSSLRLGPTNRFLSSVFLTIHISSIRAARSTCFLCLDLKWKETCITRKNYVVENCHFLCPPTDVLHSHKVTE
jgi:hypothetical protein